MAYWCNKWAFIGLDKKTIKNKTLATPIYIVSTSDQYSCPSDRPIGGSSAPVVPCVALRFNHTLDLPELFIFVRTGWICQQKSKVKRGNFVYKLCTPKLTKYRTPRFSFKEVETIWAWALTITLLQASFVHGLVTLLKASDQVFLNPYKELLAVRNWLVESTHK